MFTDVDLPNSTRIAYYDRWNRPLGTYAVPASPGSESLSFLGVRFKQARVARVRIQSGNAAIGQWSDSDYRDVVAMDDFVYGEPK